MIYTATNHWAIINWRLRPLYYLCNIHGEDTGKHFFINDIKKLKIADEREEYIMKKKTKGRKRKTKTLAEANAMNNPKLKKGRARSKIRN